MIIGYGVKGMLAIYLPGGINENTFSDETLLTLFMIDDLVPFIAWYGVAMAAVAVSWVSLRERALPFWIGIVSLVSVLPPLALPLKWRSAGGTGRNVRFSTESKTCTECSPVTIVFLLDPTRAVNDRPGAPSEQRNAGSSMRSPALDR